METHGTFVEKVASCILNCKGIGMDDYILMISQIGQPLDEIGIVLVARMYHIHVGIVQDKHFWTTRRDHNLDMCTIIFGWQGGLCFSDIKRKANVALPPPTPQKSFGPPTRPYDLRSGSVQVKKEPAESAGLPQPSVHNKPYNLRSAPMFPPYVNPKKKKLTGSLMVKSVILKRQESTLNPLSVTSVKKLHLLLQKTLTITLKQNSLATGFSVNTVLKTIKQLMNATNTN